MVKLKKKLDLVKVLFPITLEKVKKKKQKKDMKNEAKVLKERFLTLYILQENLKNHLSIPLHILVRKVDIFFMEIPKKKITRTDMIIKEPKIWQYWGKVFPGITSKSGHGEVQAVNQWTGELDYYENGEPIMYPYVRCKLTDEIINAEDSYTQAEHEDGNSRNNSIENFSFVTRPANAAKGECKGYRETEELMNKILTTIRKYK